MVFWGFPWQKGKDGLPLSEHEAGHFPLAALLGPGWVPISGSDLMLSTAISGETQTFLTDQLRLEGLNVR